MFTIKISDSFITLYHGYHWFLNKVSKNILYNYYDYWDNCSSYKCDIVKMNGYDYILNFISIYIYFNIKHK